MTEIPGSGRRDQEFSVAMRGYDRREVDQYLARLADDPGLAVPAFRKVMRGYNVEQVDTYVEYLKSRPGEQSPP